MNNPDRVRYLPDRERLSVLTAVILLAYALTRIVVFPTRLLDIQLPGAYFAITLDFNLLVTLLVAGLTATGAAWLMRDHPALQGGGSFQHWILPSLTALIIGIPLAQMPFGVSWWLGLFIGAGVLILVVIAEYIVIDDQDIRQPLAAAGLSAVSLALCLILIVTLKATGVRLFIILPVIAMGSWLVSIRVMHLRLHGERTIIEAGVIALITSQVGAGLHYWPVEPISYGLLLLGVTYALTSFFCGLIEQKSLSQAIREPILALILTWGTGLWIF
jgi:hypothetical protein